MSRLYTIVMLIMVTTVAFAGSLPDTLSGSISGSTVPNHTYVVKDSIVINVGDTLTISPGNTFIMNSPLGWVHVLGTLICRGTAAHPNLFTVPAPRDTAPGQWGGIVGDSCTLFDMEWTTLKWAGGSNSVGHAYRTIDIYSDYQNHTQTIFTDNTCIGTVDDCIGLHGGSASILRNSIKWCGAPDGDNINVKAGTIGEIAYNVIWSSGGNGIKLNADPTLLRLTNMCIHNNTIMAGGWRRVGELGYGILVDKSSRAQIYNNIIGDMYQDLEITSKADTLRTVYDNNLFFGSYDSLRQAGRYYPSDGVGRPQAHDVFGVNSADLFNVYRPYFTNDWHALDSNNDYHIVPASMATGHGFTPPVSWVNPYFPGQLPGDPNIGALGTSQILANVVLTSGWNMVSAPLQSSVNSVGALFPNVTSPAFSYEAGYVQGDSILFGNGYWVNSDGGGIATITGYPAVTETVSVQAGWNMVGGISKPIPVTSITSIPGGIVTGSFFGYNGTYFVASQVNPGLSYWVRTTQAGRLVLDAAGGTLANRIRIVHSSEMPPSPPGQKTAGNSNLPRVFALGRNYPNPFNPTTRFEVDLPRIAQVDVSVYDILGRKIATLLSGQQTAGYHLMEWNSRDARGNTVASGIYFVRMSVPSAGFTSVQKMMLLK